MELESLLVPFSDVVCEKRVQVIPKVEKFFVRLVVIVRDYWNSIFNLIPIGISGIINQNYILKVSTFEYS